jgi:hypothetical protein
MSEQKSLEQIARELMAKVDRNQLDAALTALSSGKCSEHQTPDPLNCDACNAVKWHSKSDEHRMVQAAQLRAELDRLTSELAEARGDKERLDWLEERPFMLYRSKDYETGKSMGHVVAVDETKDERRGILGNTVRAAIDAARRGE